MEHNNYLRRSREIKAATILVLCCFIGVQLIPAAPVHAEWARLVHRFDTGETDRIYSASSFSTELLFTNTIEATYKKGLLVKLTSSSSNCAANNSVSGPNEEGKYKFLFTTGPEGGDASLKYAIIGRMVPEQNVYADAKIIVKQKVDTAKQRNTIGNLILLVASSGRMYYAEPAVSEFYEAEPKDSFFDIYLKDSQGPTNGINITHDFDTGIEESGFLPAHGKRIYSGQDFNTQIEITNQGKRLMSDDVKVEIVPSKSVIMADNAVNSPKKLGLYSFGLISPDQESVQTITYRTTFPDGTVKYSTVKYRTLKYDLRDAATDVSMFLGFISAGATGAILGAGLLVWIFYRISPDVLSEPVLAPAIWYALGSTILFYSIGYLLYETHGDSFSQDESTENTSSEAYVDKKHTILIIKDKK